MTNIERISKSSLLTRSRPLKIVEEGKKSLLIVSALSSPSLRREARYATAVPEKGWDSQALG